MGDKIKNLVVTVGFVLILSITLIFNVSIKDKDISVSERRRLNQLPTINFQTLTSGDMSTKLENYVEDQFVARDYLRRIKSFSSTNIYKKLDNNNLFEKDGILYKMEYPLNEANLQKSLNKINYVYDRYLQGMNVYYAIIPDKNYYLENDEHLKIDYEGLVRIANAQLNKMNYIDIRDDLTLSDYYKTDLHWKQENLRNVVSKIENNMNLKNTSQNEYLKNSFGKFYGAYYGQLAIDVLPDELYTLTNETIEKCITYNYETQQFGTVYSTSLTADKYDTYLNGATALITIQNLNSDTEKELILFRDSFGSSIAPLLIENYRKITLVDLRYISSELLDKYINFDSQDVLFLYSTLVLNQNVLK